ncbi:uncharacterized protein A4U43_C07F27020 [Asparagus officinalis]|uniref:Uncharacterized protein n=1 Tax=Asparagus officinalis TaxID=4686 RepID=A0A5P1EF76_ASPOF|nr:uncharacterized protein A4U43_C07F27020 [Asparagus officinalis]
MTKTRQCFRCQSHWNFYHQTYTEKSGWIKAKKGDKFSCKDAFTKTSISQNLPDIKKVILSCPFQWKKPGTMMIVISMFDHVTQFSKHKTVYFHIYINLE